uniref:UL36 tegument protein n=1 Tax=Anatid alphaherpesvirus 2 TaxID=3080522 RepID=A0AAU0K6E7_9ALPH
MDDGRNEPQNGGGAAEGWEALSVGTDAVSTLQCDRRPLDVAVRREPRGDAAAAPPAELQPAPNGEWTKMVVDSANFTVAAVGFRNQYSPDLCPGSAVSCLRSSLAFLRVVFSYGIKASLSADTIDHTLLQGREWTMLDAESRGGPPEPCDPHHLPNRILSMEPNGDLCVAFSPTYGETYFYAGEDAEGVIDTQMAARRFLDRVWKSKSGDTYCLIIVGAVGIGVVRMGDDVYVFDPHGHGGVPQACVVRVPVGGFYQYLTSYADPATNPPWSATFVYFVSAGQSPPSRDELTAAVSRLYGTAEVVLGGEDRGGSEFVVTAEYDPAVKPAPLVTRIVVGVGIDGGAAALDGRVGGDVEEPEEGDRIDGRYDDEFYDAVDYILQPDDADDEMAVAPEGESAGPPSADPRRADGERGADPQGDVWGDALLATGATPAQEDPGRGVPVEPTAPDVGDATDGYTAGAPRERPTPARKGGHARQKRRRPVWTPPSSNENLAGGDRSASRATRRKQTRRERRRADGGAASSATNLTGSSTELADTIADVTYAPRGDSTEAAPTEEIDDFGRDAAESLRRRPIFNPHRAGDGGDGTARDGLWSDEYLAPYPLDALYEKVREVGEGVSAGLDTMVMVSRPMGSGDDDPLELCILDAFSRVYAYVIENGARTTPDAESVVGVESAALTAAFPVPTAFGAFVAATGMTLSEASSHSELIAAVKSEGARIGGLALGKLVLVAVEVDEATNALHATLDAVESELSGSESSGNYERMASALVGAFQKNPGGLYAETTSLRQTPTLSERVAAMCESVYAREESARRTAALLNSELTAIDAGVRRMGRTFDAFVLGGDDEGINRIDRPSQPGGEDTTPSGVSRRLAEIHKDASAVLGDAIREYFLRGASYSAKALLADARGEARYNVVVSEAVEGMRRMVDSLPDLDAAVEAAASQAGVKAPRSLAKSQEATILRDLLTQGADLSTEERLTSWKTLMVGAQTGGWIDRRELDSLMADIKTVNERASKRASVAHDLRRFEALSAAVDRMAGAEESNDQVALEALVRESEELVRAAKAIEASSSKIPASSDSADGDVRRQVANRRVAVEAVLEKARSRSAMIKATTDTAYAALRKMLRPLPNFAGLRALSSTIKSLSQSIPQDIGSVSSLVETAPPDVTGQLRSDLWTLFAQYKDALEHPTAGTASGLAGLGVPFALAIRVILGPTGGYPAASAFFGKHADAVSAAVADLAARPGCVSSAETAVSALRAAAEAVERAAARTAAGETDVAAAVAAERGDAFLFLRNLLAGAEEALAAAKDAEWRESAVKLLRATAEETAQMATRIRSADPKAADDAAYLDAIARDARRTIDGAVETATRIEAEAAARGTTPNARRAGSGGDSSARRGGGGAGPGDADPFKAAVAVHQRAAEAEAALANFERTRAEADGVKNKNAWTRAVDGALARAETRSEFDAAELQRLSEAASAAGYDASPFRQRAERVIDTHFKIVHGALDAVLGFNPYRTHNRRNRTAPPVSLLRDLTWGDAFIAAESYYSALFGVNCSTLLAALRLALTILLRANSNGGEVDYPALVNAIEGDLAQFPQLVKYVDYYRRSHDDFVGLLARVEGLRGDVLQAVGHIPSEINKALEEVALVRRPEDAKKALEYGVSLSVQGEAVIENSLAALKREDTSPYRGTAYEEYAAYIVKRDLEDAKAALETARAARADAEARARIILREVADAADAADRTAAENLANLKNLLRLAPIPPHVAKALDKADTADDVVTQAALLLARVEEAEEIDPQAVEWLQQAAAIINSHPLTVLIDETGPMTRYEERIAALVDARKNADDLRVRLTAAETTWDDAWAAFVKDRDKISRSSEGYATARQRAAALTAASNVIATLTSEPIYGRISVKVRAQLENKRRERAPALESFSAAVAELEGARKQMEALMARVPGEYAAGPLRQMAAQYDDLVRRLPKWHAAGSTRLRRLIGLRLAMYAAYAALDAAATAKGGSGGAADVTQHGDPPLQPVDADPRAGQNDGGDKTSASAERHLKARVAAWMGSRVVATLQEATSDVDMAGTPTYLDASGDPIRYALCYRTAGDKMAAALCDPALASVRPPIPSEPITHAETEAAAGVLSEILTMRLEYTHAVSERFEKFARFVRLRRPDWRPGENTRAVAETYTALIATTLTRRTGADWSDIYVIPGAGGPMSDREAVRAALTPPGGGKSAKVIRMDPADVMVTAVAWAPGHVVNFAKLDLMRQHEYMDRTLYKVVESAVEESAFVNCLAPPAQKTANARPLSFTGSRYDPSGGCLFSLLYSDWRPGRLSETDPLKPWEEGGAEAVAGLAKIRATVPSNVLTTVTVLARMCVPPMALSAMWTAMRPDDVDQELKSYDDVVTSRLDAAATLDVITSSASSRPADSAGDAAGFTDPDEPVPLYAPTGSSSTFTVVSAPPSGVRRVNAMDMAVAATIFGARVVVAAECPGAYSEESDVTMCIRLFDSRFGARGCYLEPQAVSTDLISWGGKLLASGDANPVERACLTRQLERLSGLVASKPLASAPPCLIVTGDGMYPSRVLWAKPVFDPPPAIRLFSDCDDVLAELPYVELDDAPYDESAAGADAPLGAEAAEAVDFFSDDSRAYPNPRYRGEPDDGAADAASSSASTGGNGKRPGKHSRAAGSDGESDIFDDSFSAGGEEDDYLSIDKESAWGRFLSEEPTPVEGAAAAYLDDDEFSPILDATPSMTTISARTDDSVAPTPKSGPRSGRDVGGDEPGSRSTASSVSIKRGGVASKDDRRPRKEGERRPPPVQSTFVEDSDATPVQGDPDGPAGWDALDDPRLLPALPPSPEPQEAAPPAFDLSEPSENFFRMMTARRVKKHAPTAAPKETGRRRDSDVKPKKTAAPVGPPNVRTAAETAPDGADGTLPGSSVVTPGDGNWSKPKIVTFVDQAAVVGGETQPPRAPPGGYEPAPQPVKIVTGSSETTASSSSGGGLLADLLRADRDSEDGTGPVRPRPAPTQPKPKPPQAPQKTKKPAAAKLKSWASVSNVATAAEVTKSKESVFGPPLPPPETVEAPRVPEGSPRARPPPALDLRGKGKGSGQPPSAQTLPPIPDSPLPETPPPIDIVVGSAKAGRGSYAPGGVDLASALRGQDEGISPGRPSRAATSAAAARKPAPPQKPSKPAAKTQARGAAAPRSTDVQGPTAVPTMSVALRRRLPPPLPPSSDEDFSEDDDDVASSSSSGDEDEFFPREPQARERGPRGRNVIPADDLLTRRGFRRASRGALHSLLLACSKIAKRIAFTRRSLTAKALELTIDLAKIKMILVG